MAPVIGVLMRFLILALVLIVGACSDASEAPGFHQVGNRDLWGGRDVYTPPQEDTEADSAQPDDGKPLLEVSLPPDTDPGEDASAPDGTEAPDDDTASTDSGYVPEDTGISPPDTADADADVQEDTQPPDTALGPCYNQPAFPVPCVKGTAPYCLAGAFWECKPVENGCFALFSTACDDGKSCTIDTCNSAGTGCLFIESCDDGVACSTEGCGASGACEYTYVNEDCSDGVACTLDTCTATGCTFTPSAALCQDGNLCTGDACDPVDGCSHTDLAGDCDDGNVCTTDSCEATAGCVYKPVPLPDDGDPCTETVCDPVTGIYQQDAHDFCVSWTDTTPEGCEGPAIQAIFVEADNALYEAGTTPYQLSVVIDGGDVPGVYTMWEPKFVGLPGWIHTIAANLVNVTIVPVNMMQLSVQPYGEGRVTILTDWNNMQFVVAITTGFQPPLQYCDVRVAKTDWALYNYPYGLPGASITIYFDYQ